MPALPTNILVLMFASVGTALIVGVCVLVRRRRLRHALRPDKTVVRLTGRDPMTASEAVTLARKAWPRGARAGGLLSVSSGEDLDAAGRSYAWRAVFAVHNGSGTGVAEFHPEPDELGDVRGARLELSVAMVPPATEAVLPEPFRDSCKVMRDAARKGVDPGGATRVCLSARAEPGREPRWKLEIDRKTATTRFTTSAA
ncbi:MAG: hypothetical protein ACF8Q5_05575 [Phycisphaerales bacterium JB040]